MVGFELDDRRLIGKMVWLISLSRSSDIRGRIRSGEPGSGIKEYGMASWIGIFYKEFSVSS
jgi:hypothetical protein